MNVREGFPAFLRILDQNPVLRRGMPRNDDVFSGYLDYLFTDIDFERRTMLDVGGGNGTFSLYAACMGADRAVLLEPGSAGSHDDVLAVTDTLRDLYEEHRIDRILEKFQDFDPGDQRFDIILLHASVNHLDEEACLRLPGDRWAKDRYLAIFLKISRLCAPGGTVVVFDCAPRNFFRTLGLPNPFAPSIEWEKHQPPECWSAFLAACGFSSPRVRWLSLPHPVFGRHMTVSRRLAYFLASQFCLTMEKP